ncbi:hypothetical protein RHGRI_025949 [Rhododendron griersonianum]|uniref:NAA35-like N-terminal domain-containing protein n=1 Tax=Rhododendron griersonianum TaxID=479676 RepID=A0AAV6ITA8_9ERIC|nr:hypothetical protein RHGRI_025949 [Rhododendron griersonianum]
MDHLLACEATWHKGHSLAQTVFPCIYLLKPDRTSPHALLHSYCRVIRAPGRRSFHNDLWFSFEGDGDEKCLSMLHAVEETISRQLRAYKAPPSKRRVVEDIEPLQMNPDLEEEFCKETLEVMVSQCYLRKHFNHFMVSMLESEYLDCLKGSHIITRHSFSEEFDRDIYANMDLDIYTKRAAQKVSASLVSLVSRTGSEPFFMGSGTIIESEEVDGTHFSTILTSASLLRSTPESDAIPDDIKIDVYLSDGKSSEGQVFAYDFHYNIATIKIKTELALPSAALRFLDDSISVDPSAILESSQLHPRSDLFKLCPGDMVVAVGRHFDEHCELMAAPGKFSLDCGIGGSLINLYGEVIGVNFYDSKCTPFLPINIAAKCLEHFKKYGRFCRPWLGMEMTNLYAENLGILEKIIHKFPNISKGVLVEEFYGMIMEKTGESLELVVLRETSGQRLQITLKASETSRDEFYRWPLPEECVVHVDRVRW